MNLINLKSYLLYLDQINFIREMRAYGNYGYTPDDFSSTYQDNNAWYYYNYGYNYEPQFCNSQWNSYAYTEDQSPYNDYDYTESNKIEISAPNSGLKKVTKNRSSMLSSKDSGRVFYPSKVRHSRHNSQEAFNKQDKLNFSPMNKSDDST